MSGPATLLDRSGLGLLLRRDDPLGPMRLATFICVAISVLGLVSIEAKVDYLLALVFVAVGSWFSHWYRGRNWFVKGFLAVGMLYLLYQYLANLFLYIQDTRMPLAQLLLWLSVLNSFDLPRRHNLRIAQMVGIILMVVTASLSREMLFGAVLVAFVGSLLVCGHLDMLSEYQQKPAIRPMGRDVATNGWAVLIAAVVLFLLLPRGSGGYLRQLPMSTMVPLPFQVSSRVQNPAYPSGSPASGARQLNPEAYYGFSETLDLNFRGRLSDNIAVKIRSNRSEFWRGMAYDVYNGRSWSMSAPNDVENLTVANLPFNLPASSLSGGGSTQVRTLYVESDQSNLVLLPPNPRQLYFPANLIFRDRYGGYRSPLVLEKGLYYSVVAETVNWNERILESAFETPPALAAKLANYLAVPKSLPKRVRDLAAAQAEGLVSPYHKVQALRGYLKQHFPYDLAVPPFPPQVDTIDYFLFEAKRGYCEHFATALTVMARSVGVPARLVTGYMPGRYNPFTGFWDVRTSDAHAWTECYFAGIGWVPFDATPGAPSPTEFTEDQAAPPALALVGYAHERLGAGFWVILAGILALVALSAWVFSPGRLALRQLERLARTRNAFLATRAYLRLLDLLERHGLKRRSGWTPAEHAREAAKYPVIAPVVPLVEDFMTAYEAARFGDADPGDLEARLVVIRKELTTAGR